MLYVPSVRASVRAVVTPSRGWVFYAVAGALLGRRTFSLMGSEDEHDLVIRNAFIVDGSGALGYHGAHDAIQLVPLRARNAGCAE